MTEGIPVDVLEKRAADERRQLHNSVQELRESVHERLDVKRNVRNHLGDCLRRDGGDRTGPGLYRNRRFYPRLGLPRLLAFAGEGVKVFA